MAPQVSQHRLASAAGGPTRDRILDAAESLFAEHGLSGTSVRDIARAVGVTPGNLYNHFASKEALYQAVLVRGIEPLVELITGLRGREHSDALGEEFIDSLMAYLATRPHLPRLIHSEAVTGGEHLVPLARDWIRPLFDTGVAEISRDSDTPWDGSEQPLAIAAWLHLVFGHFAMAPLLREVLGEDPLSPEVLERQTGFLRKVVRLLMRPNGQRAAEDEAAR